MNSAEKTRLIRLYNLANARQNDAEWETWSNITKQVLSYVLHGDEEMRLGIELELRKANL